MHFQEAPEGRGRFIELCRKAGLKITPQRCSVYEHFVRLKTHPTAEDIYRAVRKEHPNISYDTVHRTLLTFAEIGLAEIVHTKGGARRFDPVLDGHHHFQCVACGDITDFSSKACDDLKIPEGIRRRHTVFTKKVVLSGLCRECRESKGSAGKSDKYSQY